MNDPVIRGASQAETHVTSEAAATALGRQIRAVRQQRGLSMQALAVHAEISRAWLGEVERGTASASVDMVRRLANSLGVSISSLLDGRAAHVVPEAAEVLQKVHLVRSNERPTLRFPSQPFEWTVATPLQGELQIIIADLAPTQGAMELMEHGGQESVLVLYGSLEVHVGVESFVLAEGDCITFHANLPHGFMNKGPAPARMLNATSPPSIGEWRHTN